MLAAYPDLVRREKIANFVPSTYAMERDYKHLRADFPGRLRLDDAGPQCVRRGRRCLARDGRERRGGARRTARGRSSRCCVTSETFDLARLTAGPLG